MNDSIKRRRVALGESIRQRREDQGFSQDSLAKMIGTSKSHIWRIEKGRVSVSFDHLVRIADALNVEMRDLFSF